MDIPKVRYTPPLVQKEEKKATVDEIAEGEIENIYTHEQALEYMGITESEFLELLIESENCPSGKLDKNRIYPKELIFEIDPEKWVDTQVYTLEEIYGDVANNTYTLEETLKILKFLKSKFQDELVKNRFCTAEEFDSIKEFPFLWLRVIDSNK